MVKMRVSKDNYKTCICCGADKEHSLEMFDICFSNNKSGGIIVTLCDRCNDDLLTKSVRAACLVNHRVKSKRDMQIINERSKKAMKELYKNDL